MITVLKPGARKPLSVRCAQCNRMTTIEAGAARMCPECLAAIRTAMRRSYAGGEVGYDATMIATVCAVLAAVIVFVLLRLF